jgi:hypothetical protein
MKLLKQHHKTLLVLLLSLFSLTSTAKTVKFETLEVNYGSLSNGSSGVRFKGGNLIISDNSTLSIESDIKIKDLKGNLKGKITLKGIDKKGKDQNYFLNYDNKVGEFFMKGKITINGTNENPIYINEVIISVTDDNNKTTIASENLNTDANKTSFAILLNGHAKPGRGICNTGKCYCLSGFKPTGKVLDLGNSIVEQTLKIDKEKNTSSLSYSIGFDKQSTTDNEILESLLTWGEVELSAEVSIKDEKGEIKKITTTAQYNEKLGAHFISDQFSAGHTRTQRISDINLIFTNPENDKYTLKQILFGGVPEGASSEGYSKETWLILQNIKDCKEIELNNVYLNENNSSKFFAVVIGLNNTKKDNPTPLEARLSGGGIKVTGHYVWTEGHDKRTLRIIKPTVDKNGNWTFADSLPIKDTKNPPILENFQLLFLDDCNDTIKFESVYKTKLNDKKPWDYKVKMGNTNAIDNPTFEPANGGMTNIMALTFPSSSVTISSGNFIISNNSKLTVGIVNNMAISNGIDTKKVTDANIDIQYSVAGDGRVFWHWSFPVTTTNPKGVIDIDTNKFNPIKIESAEIRFITDEKDTIIYESNGKFASSMDGKTMYLLLEKTGKRNYIDPCKTQYKLKEIFTQEGTESNIYGLYLSFSFENNSDLPAKISMNVEITDCNNKTQYIELKLNYDTKSGLYYASQAITTSSNCKLEITAGNVTVTNACNVKTNWNFDASQAKAVGPGGKCSSNKQCRLQVCKLG